MKLTRTRRLDNLRYDVGLPSEPATVSIPQAVHKRFATGNRCLDW